MRSTKLRWMIAVPVALFSLMPLEAQTVTTLHSFVAPLDGELPSAGLVQGTDGNFYGITEIGGYNGVGTIFKITPSGILTTLYNFDGDIPISDDQPFVGQLVQGTDGSFYGTTMYTGAYDCGEVFEITPGGTLTTLHSFINEPEGALPSGGLVQGTDGNFYGTTSGGGANTYGTVFKITPSGTLTTLYSFSCDPSGCADGDGTYPKAGLVQGTDGNFYGTTPYGGANGDGTVFKITPSGVLTTLHSFDGEDGSNPYAGLVQGTDGNFYGTASAGGSGPCGFGGCGAVFMITPTGTLTTLYNFSATYPVSPYGGLVEGTDGNFYGTTEQGGASSACTVGGGCGTVFMITPSGTLTTLYSFGGYPDGAEPWDALVEGTDGNFYGTTEQGGAYADGTVFRLDSWLSTFSLTVASVGQGTVTSLDYKINCSNAGGVCRANYAAGASTTLDAAPAAGWSLTGWSGPCSGTGSCNVTMSSN